MSSVTCKLHGLPSPELYTTCPGPPPSWEWWRDYRYCTATNVCLRDKELFLYSGSELLYNTKLPRRGTIACNSWNADSSYIAKQKKGKPPQHALWFQEPVIHTQRILNTHFGHDVLNNYFWIFSTFWEEGLNYLWSNKSFHVPGFFHDNVESSTISPFFVRYINYDKDKLYCFKKAILSTSHLNDINLVFKQKNPTTQQKLVWADYRDLLVSRACPSCTKITPYDRKNVKCNSLNIVVLKRKKGNKNTKLFADGEGRNIINHDELVNRLSIFGKVLTIDPGDYSFGTQISLVMNADIIISRMSSQVVSSMFMRPGGLCLEIESSDPSHLYYDHHSTFEELSDMFDHTFMRSSPRYDNFSLPIVGNLYSCKAICQRFNIFKFPEDNLREKKCKQRCHKLMLETDAYMNTKDHYLRSEWFMNWWLSDVNADIPAIIDLINQWCNKKNGIVSVKHPEHKSKVYTPSKMEGVWNNRIAQVQSDDPEWTRGCSLIQSQEGEIKRLMDAIVTKKYDTRLFSSWNGNEFIEPLIGHLRHPYFHCLGPYKDTFNLMFDTTYIVLPQTVKMNYNQVILIDVGASTFDDCSMGCQKWFVDSYKKIGMEFDRIIGWEAKPLNHLEYWSKIPDDLKHKIQLFNIPASSDTDSSNNPLHHLSVNTHPNDYVVFKLDIDNIEVETKLVNQILNSPKLLEKIDEFYWEHHAWGSPLKKTRVQLFGNYLGWKDHTSSEHQEMGRLEHTYKVLTTLRHHGIRAHAWI